MELVNRPAPDAHRLGIAGSVEEGEAMCHRAVSSGRAMELFLSNVARQGGISQAQGAQGETIAPNMSRN